MFVDVQSAKLMARGDIRAEIARRQDEYSVKTDFKVENALSILASIAESDGEKSADRIRAIEAWAKMTGNSQERFRHGLEAEVPQTLADLIRKVGAP